MGLLESIAGKALGTLGGDAQKGVLLREVVGLLTSQGAGGLGGLVEQFKSKGLGDIVNSWVGTGQNMPISPGQVQQGLGADAVNRLAAKAGIPADQASALLARFLPKAVDGLTPDGQVPKGDIAQDAMKVLGKLLG